MNAGRNGHQSVSKTQKAEPTAAPRLSETVFDNKFSRNRHDRIAAVAHGLWDKRGRPGNDDLTEWLASEAQAQENGGS